MQASRFIALILLFLSFNACEDLTKDNFVNSDESDCQACDAISEIELWEIGSIHGAVLSGTLEDVDLNYCVNCAEDFVAAFKNYDFAQIGIRSNGIDTDSLSLEYNTKIRTFDHNLDSFLLSLEVSGKAREYLRLGFDKTNLDLDVSVVVASLKTLSIQADKELRGIDRLTVLGTLTVLSDSYEFWAPSYKGGSGLGWNYISQLSESKLGSQMSKSCSATDVGWTVFADGASAATGFLGLGIGMATASLAAASIATGGAAVVAGVSIVAGSALASGLELLIRCNQE